MVVCGSVGVVMVVVACVLCTLGLHKAVAMFKSKAERAAASATPLERLAEGGDVQFEDSEEESDDGMEEEEREVAGDSQETMVTVGPVFVNGVDDLTYGHRCFM